MNDQLKSRDVGMFALLMVVTLGFYVLYLVPKLGKSVNYLTKNEKYSFGLCLFLCIITLGIAGLVYEVRYAYDLERNSGYTQGKWSNKNLGGYVLVLNILSILIMFASGGLGGVISFALGCWATWLIQDQVNKYIEFGEGDMQGNANASGAGLCN